MLTSNESPVPMLPATHATVPSKLGDLTVVARGGAVVGVYFPHHWYRPDPASFGPRSEAGFGTSVIRSASTWPATGSASS